MPKYTLKALVTVSCWTEVEADTEEEAIRKGEERELASHDIGSFYAQEEYWLFDNDGVPTKVEIDKD